MDQTNGSNDVTELRNVQLRNIRKTAVRAGKPQAQFIMFIMFIFEYAFIRSWAYPIIRIRIPVSG